MCFFGEGEEPTRKLLLALTVLLSQNCLLQRRCSQSQTCGLLTQF